ncbi:unnamed protein product [Didymodactylos carnosus]|uniref:glutathione gamma-glutamylcysteinyltransferase n=1 Tax=Didymodactylos carnosus TaxID=1234261 RepID=A0A815S095_9BILA|nr:unnamed protein product [Didymodactylos carnosus]CAF4349661.1 unnamed protein product [Didymodactylos carnosus]
MERDFNDLERREPEQFARFKKHLLTTPMTPIRRRLFKLKGVKGWENMFESSKKKQQQLSVEDLWYPSIITPLDTTQGQLYYSTSNHDAHNLLIPNYEFQEHLSFCGIACTTILLNTMYAKEIENKKYCKVTQNYLYQNVVQMNEKTKMSNGMTLEQVSVALNIGGLKTIIRYGSKNLVEFENTLRNDIEQYLVTCSAFIICNYWRQFRNKSGNGDTYVQQCGHHSLLSAYDSLSDQVLVLDPTKNRFAHHWIMLEHLASSMCTTDAVSVRPRGYLLVYRQNIQ